MKIIPHKKIFLTIAAILVAASITAIVIWGLPLGIDFTGGALLEADYQSDRPANDVVRNVLNPIIGDVQVQPTGERGIIVRGPAIDETTHQNVLAALRAFGDFEEHRFESIGPTIGRELQKKAVTALIIVLGLIILYIAWAFRKVSRPVSSWKYGLAAVIALVHDVTIPTGIVAALGQFGTFQIDAFFITALLTILGFSVHDTIIVFDRIRENLKRVSNEPFEAVTNRSVNEVMSRSINTSLTIILVLLAVLFLGGETTKNLALVLTLGGVFGTYSSIFVASPLLTLWAKGGKRV